MLRWKRRVAGTGLSDDAMIMVDRLTEVRTIAQGAMIETFVQPLLQVIHPGWQKTVR